MTYKDIRFLLALMLVLTGLLIYLASMAQTAGYGIRRATSRKQTAVLENSPRIPRPPAKYCYLVY